MSWPCQQMAMVFAFFGADSPLWVHCFDSSFVLGVKWWAHVSSMVMNRRKKSALLLWNITKDSIETSLRRSFGFIMSKRGTHVSVVVTSFVRPLWCFPSGNFVMALARPQPSKTGPQPQIKRLTRSEPTSCPVLAQTWLKLGIFHFVSLSHIKSVPQSYYIFTFSSWMRRYWFYVKNYFRNFHQIFTFWDPLSQKKGFLRKCLSVCLSVVGRVRHNSR